MRTNYRICNAFTLIESRIARVIIVAILVGVFSIPMQARADSAVTQVKDGLRQISDAFNLTVKQGKACCAEELVIRSGNISVYPAIPAGIAAVSYAAYQREPVANFHPGGCGKNNHGERVTIMADLRGVTDQFCRDYNAAQGLTSKIFSNCEDTACASGSTNGSSPEAVAAKSFCYYNKTDTLNIVLYNTGLNGNADTDMPGDNACP